LKEQFSRRRFLQVSGATALSATSIAGLLRGEYAHAQSGGTLTIAYNTALPSLDPTNSAKTSSPAVQSIFKAIFDPYIEQNPDLSFGPGALTKWGWNKDKSAIELTLRKGMLWHDGSPVTTRDLVWSLERAGERFDTIVLDPPAFAKNKASVPKALTGYREINLRALKILSPGGHLVTCSCSYNVDEASFAQVLYEASVDAGVHVNVVEKRMQGRDHPVLLGMPETYYLKCFILRRIE